MREEDLRESCLSEKEVFHGKLIYVTHQQVRLPNGQQALREVVRHIGAAAVVPVDAEGNVTLVWQYRAALGKLTLEIPAGKLDHPQEDPLACARRELTEETGLWAEDWRFLTRLDTTPGFCDERISLYLAQGLSQHETRPDEDEFLGVERLPLDQALARVMAGEITDSKTMAGLLMTGQILGISPAVMKT